jgi:hypothetical protein
MDRKIEELLKDSSFLGSLYSVRTPRGVEPSGFDITIPVNEGFINLICVFGVGSAIYLNKNREEIKREDLSEEECEQILKIISDAKE